MTTIKTGFDWPGLMQVAIRGLSMKPHEFWALTPAELWLLLGPELGEIPMGRGRLDELTQAYPDKSADIGADDG